MKKVLKKLQEIQKTVAWINQEEVQLKYPMTTFPEVAEITNGIDPYIRLYGYGLNWQRSMKRWLDGNFDNLSYEVIEQETDEISRFETQNLPIFFYQVELISHMVCLIRIPLT